MEFAVERDLGVLRVAEVAQRLSLCPMSVYNLIDRGELQLVKIGSRASGVPIRSLRDFLERRAAEAAAQRNRIEERRAARAQRREAISA